MWRYGARGRCRLRGLSLPASPRRRGRAGGMLWWGGASPPAFAKSRQSVDAAARGYKEINLRALRLLPASGILVTCSCSHHVSEAMFLELVAEAALDANRTLRVLE